MNVKLLRKVRDYITLHPNRFVMSCFLVQKEAIQSQTFSNDRGKEIKFDKCGTAACIAGWTCLIKLKGKNQIGDIAERAGEFLNIDEEQQARLFYDGSWPQEYFNEYSQATTQKKMAEVAGRRIDHFIKTKGRE